MTHVFADWCSVPTHCCRAREVYVILEGKVRPEVELFMGYHLRPKTTATIRKVGQGGTFGWSALIEPYHRTMTARCSKDTDLIVVSSHDLKALLNVHLDIGLMVMRNVAKIVYDGLVHARQHLIAEFRL